MSVWYITVLRSNEWVRSTFTNNNRAIWMIKSLTQSKQVNNCEPRTAVCAKRWSIFIQFIYNNFISEETYARTSRNFTGTYFWVHIEREIDYCDLVINFKLFSSCFMKDFSHSCSNSLFAIFHFYYGILLHHNHKSRKKNRASLRHCLNSGSKQKTKIKNSWVFCGFVYFLQKFNQFDWLFYAINAKE